jgi:hypothetical protein
MCCVHFLVSTFHETQFPTPLFQVSTNSIAAFSRFRLQRQVGTKIDGITKNEKTVAAYQYKWKVGSNQAHSLRASVE